MKDEEDNKSKLYLESWEEGKLQNKCAYEEEVDEVIA